MKALPTLRRSLLQRPRPPLPRTLLPQRMASVQAKRKARAASISPVPQPPPKQIRRPAERLPPFRMLPKPILTLTPEEDRLRNLLLDVVKDIYACRRHPDMKPLKLRFTGGWVRDKIMGIQSHDIDVAIDKMTGYEFGMWLNRYLAANQEKYGISPQHVHRIESNPEKSKHLETATTRIMGLDIDLVNLRKEVYTGDSRIPQTEFGTPEEDALRRDCTINALFYNLRTQEIEDFTKRGLQDIHEAKIRTPLEPYQTFEDDPLRVLRLIRFSSKFNFEILMEAVYAIETPEIQKALALKISRERIGTEIEKMLTGPRPHLALSQIHHFGLYCCIFAPDSKEMHSSHMYFASCALHYILTHEEAAEAFPQIRSLLQTPEEQYLGWLCAAFVPWSHRNVGYLVDKKGIAPAAAAAKETLKACNRVFGSLNVAFRSVKVVEEAIEAIKMEALGKRKLGMLIRQLGADWKTAVICSLLLSIVKSSELYELKPNAKSMAKLKKYENFVAHVQELGLADAHNFKHILNGKEVTTLLGMKAGKWMKDAMDKIMEWQLEHEDATKEEAEAWIKENKEALVAVEEEGK